MTDAERDALARYLMAVADDELVIGYRDTEWTGVAPMLEEDIAFASIGQDEVGHARLFYSLLRELTGSSADFRARAAHEYRPACLLEMPSAPVYRADGAHTGGSDWAFAIVRQYLYDHFDAERLRALKGSAWAPLARAVDKLEREEKYHLQHVDLWLDRLAGGPPEARARLERALVRAWPDAFGLFEPIGGEAILLVGSLLTASSDTLRDRWLDRIAPTLARYGLAVPATRGPNGWRVEIAPSNRGRSRHTPAWEAMWDEMTSVYRLEPAATW